MRLCLLAPPTEADEAAIFLDAAAIAVLDGQMETAADLLQRADIRTLYVHAATVMSPTSELLGFSRRVLQFPLETIVQRGGPRMPTGADAETIFIRDGYRCRYCGCRVVRPGVRSLLTSLFPQIVRWPMGKGGDRAKHAAFYALNGVLDHVEPYARGGDSSINNMVTACWPCNFGKEDYTIEELGFYDPRLRQPIVDDWDGLKRLVRHRRKPSQSPVRQQASSINFLAQDVDGWLSLMTSTISPGVLDALRDLLISLDEITSVSLSIRRNVTVNVTWYGQLLSVLGISLEGDVDVPWRIEGEKEWFKPFAKSLVNAIPETTIYETAKMWRVDGCGMAKGQITIDELVGAAAVVLDSIKSLAGNQADPRL